MNRSTVGFGLARYAAERLDQPRSVDRIFGIDAVEIAAHDQRTGEAGDEANEIGCLVLRVAMGVGMIGSNRQPTRRGSDLGDQPSALVELHLVRFRNRMAAQDRVAPGFVVKRGGLIGKVEQTRIVHRSVDVLPAEQRLIENQDVRSQVGHDSPRGVGTLSIQLAAFVGRGRHWAKALQDVVGDETQQFGTQGFGHRASAKRSRCLAVCRRRSRAVRPLLVPRFAAHVICVRMAACREDDETHLC